MGATMLSQVLFLTLSFAFVRCASFDHFKRVPMGPSNGHGLRRYFLLECENTIERLVEAVDRQSLRRLKKWSLISVATFRNLEGLCESDSHDATALFDSSCTQIPIVRQTLSGVLNRARPLFVPEFQRAVRRLSFYSNTASRFAEVVKSTEFACAQALTSQLSLDVRTAILKGHFVLRFAIELGLKLNDACSTSRSLIVDTNMIFGEDICDDVTFSQMLSTRDELHSAISNVQGKVLVLRSRISSLNQMTKLLEARAQSSKATTVNTP